MARIQDSADPLTVTNKPIVAGSLAAANAPKAKPGTSTAQRAVESAGFEDTEAPASKKKRKMTSAAAARKSKTTSMRKARTQGPMKGATKTENGVKYTYDGTNWVKSPTL